MVDSGYPDAERPRRIATACELERAKGFEFSQWQGGSLPPYHSATPA